MSVVMTQPEMLVSVSGSGQAVAIHEIFANALGTSSGSYVVTKAANAAATG